MTKKETASRADEFKRPQAEAPETQEQGGTSESQQIIKTLEDRVAALTTQLEASEKESLLLVADMKNEAQRAAKHAKQQELFATQKLMVDLLPALDALEAALNAAGEQLTLESLLKGCEMTHAQILSILAAKGLEKINPEPLSPFDPESHEAIQMLHDPEAPSGVVLATYQAGYRLSGRVIRTAKVSVNA